MLRRLALLAAAVALAAGTAHAGPVVDALAPAPPPPPTAPGPTPRTVFSGAGVLVGSASSVDPVALAELERRSGFTWAAVKVADGGEPRNADELTAGWADRLRERGIAVGGWSVLRGDPARDAGAALSAIASGRLAFYVADAEFSYGVAGGGTARSGEFVALFRARAPPGLPVALSSFGRVDGGYGMDWRAWRDAGFEFLPQAYLADGDAFAPALAVAAALPVWPRELVHPTIGVYGGVGVGAYLGPALGGGFSVFPGELMTPADFAALAPYARASDGG